MDARERPALRNNGNHEEHLGTYGELREETGRKTHLHTPIDYAKTLKLRFRVGDLVLPERRKRYACSRGEEEEDMHRCALVAKQ